MPPSALCWPQASFCHHPWPLEYHRPSLFSSSSGLKLDDVTITEAGGDRGHVTAAESALFEPLSSCPTILMSTSVPVLELLDLGQFSALLIATRDFNPAFLALASRWTCAPSSAQSRTRRIFTPAILYRQRTLQHHHQSGAVQRSGELDLIISSLTSVILSDVSNCLDIIHRQR